MAPPRRDLPILDRPADLAAEYAAAGSLEAFAAHLGVSASTIRRAMVRHGIRRNQRNTNRRVSTSSVLDDAEWLRKNYASRTGVELAAELEVSPTTVYRALRRHGIERRRRGHGQHQRRDARLSDVEWLAAALPQSSATQVAKRLHVSPGTVTNAYRRANLDPRTTRRLNDRGRLRPRP